MTSLKHNSYKLLLLILLASFINSCSNKKELQYFAETSRVLNEQQLVNRFLQVPINASEDVKKILANIAKTEKTTPFLANYAAKYGVPVWQYMFGSNSNLATSSQSIVSNYTTFGSSSSSNNKGFYFIPLTDSVTKRTKAFIYCQQYNDTVFTYKTFDIDEALTSNPATDSLKNNKNIALGFAAYFERKINGSVKTEAFKNNKYSHTDIRKTNDFSTTSNTTSSNTQVLVVPSGICREITWYIVDFGDGEIWAIGIGVPCAQTLPEVVVISNPGGSGGSFVGGSHLNLPAPPSLPPGLNPGVGGIIAGGGSTQGAVGGIPPTLAAPPDYGSSNGLIVPTYWVIWDANADPNLFTWGNIYLQHPVIYSPQLQSLITTLGLNQTQISWLNSNTDEANTLFNYLNANNTTEARDIAIWAISYFMQYPNINMQIFTNQFLGKSEGYEGPYDSYWDNPNLTFPPQNLPSWNDFRAAFPLDSDPLYYSPEKMYTSIGGELTTFYNNNKDASGNLNTCAIRLSKALNYSGIIIPNIPGKTKQGADGKYYFKVSKDMNQWMRKTFGTNPASGTTPINTNHYHFTSSDAGTHGVNLPSLLNGKKGIYSLVSSDPSWATGHCDLLNPNSICGNKCHFYDAPIDYIDIWELQ